MVKYLSFHNSSFALWYLSKWQGHSVTQPLFNLPCLLSCSRGEVCWCRDICDYPKLVHIFACIKTPSMFPCVVGVESVQSSPQVNSYLHCILTPCTFSYFVVEKGHDPLWSKVFIFVCIKTPKHISVGSSFFEQYSIQFKNEQFLMVSLILCSSSSFLHVLVFSCLPHLFLLLS